MRAIHRLHYDRAPSVWALYPRLAVSRKPAVVPDGVQVPHIEAVLPRVAISRAHLDAYSEVCSIRDTATHLPIAYPHMLAAPLHLAILGAEAFPVRALGLIHLRNRIAQRRAIEVDAVGGARVWVAGHREVAKGQEFDFHTEFRIGDDVVWDETSVYLARRSRTPADESLRRAVPDKSSAKLAVDPEGPSKSSSFRVYASIGRRYARVSGDYNPIHLGKLSAKLFGFRRAIAHGMWSLARCAAELERDLLASPCELSVEFKTPIFLPAWVLLQHWQRAEGYGLSLRDAHANKAHLAGTLHRLG
ncbi:MAG TPA: MaoC/PaaZ C-terminal domain-containing protein [Steroidobacteraceae bacterium]|nr:MaoC/PaaZ C-terminal domain-containing protein [Steroidobacteraceae bacterium]